MRRLFVLAVAACSAPSRPAPAPVQPAPTAPTPTPTAVAPPPAAPAMEMLVAESPAPAFRDPERRKKLEAAFPAIDKMIEAEMKAQGLPGVAVGIVIDGELAYAKGFGVTNSDA